MRRKFRKNRPSPIAIKYAADQARPLIGYLNEPTGSAAVRARVLRVFDLCVQLDHLSKKAPMLPLPPMPPPGFAQYTVMLDRLQREVTADLRAFRLTPALHGGLGPYWVNWLPLRAHKFTKREIKLGKESGELPVPPLAAVKAILDLTVAGALSDLTVEGAIADRVVRCPICSRWHFRRSLKRVVCSEPCRKKKSKQAHAEKVAAYRADGPRWPKPKKRSR